MKKNSIGFYGNTYPSKRMIINKVDSVIYQPIEEKRKIKILILKLLGKMSKKFRYSSIYYNNIFFTLKFKKNKSDLIHTYNRICIDNNVKWVSTFEKTLPAYISKDNDLDERFIANQVKYICSDNCLAIMPISKWAYKYQINLLKDRVSKDELNKIINKMHVLYPPQEVLISPDELKNKFCNDYIQFLFVGRELKRKGGLEVIKAFSKFSIIKNIRLIVIGSLDSGVNAYSITREEKEEIRKLIKSNRNIVHYESLPNNEVLQIMKESHIGLLPTIGDTFGFSVLEMQACGCPVISTNREALSEFNNEDLGWIINTSSLKIDSGDDYGNYTAKEVKTVSDYIFLELEKIIAEVIKDRKQIYEKAEKCLVSILQNNNPITYEELLNEIYCTTLVSDKT